MRQPYQAVGFEGQDVESATRQGAWPDVGGDLRQTQQPRQDECRGPCQPGLLGAGDAGRRAAMAGRAPGAHLDKHNDIAVQCHDVDLAGAAAQVAGKAAQPCLLEVIHGECFVPGATALRGTGAGAGGVCGIHQMAATVPGGLSCLASSPAADRLLLCMQGAIEGHVTGGIGQRRGVRGCRHSGGTRARGGHARRVGKAGRVGRVMTGRHPSTLSHYAAPMAYA